jgi:hypothetical protein
MNSSGTGKQILPALLKVQKELEKVKKGEVNPFFKSNYADLNSVIDVCKEPLNNAGILVLQPVGHDEHGDYVETILVHAESGEIMSDKMRLIATTDPQKQGSAITYARRYALQSMLFMQAVDDDGNTASMPVKTTTAVHTPINNTTIDTTWKCQYCYATKTPLGKVFHKPSCPVWEGK